MIRVGGPAATKENIQIVTAARFKTYMQMSGSKEDGLIDIVLDSIHRIVFRMIGERFLVDLTPAPTSADKHDYLVEGNGAGVLKLPQWPIKDIDSVRAGYVDGRNPSTDWVTTYTYTLQDYMFHAETGRLFGLRRGFSQAKSSIRVVWTAGYDTFPEDLIDAVLQFAGTTFKRASMKRWDQLSIGDQAQTTVYTVKAMPKEARKVLSSYRPLGATFG